MKRKNYRVWLNISAGCAPNDDSAIEVGVKHAFNSAMAAGEKALAMWAAANNLPGEWRKTEGGIIRRDHTAVSGFRAWAHAQSGRQVRVEVELLGPKL